MYVVIGTCHKYLVNISSAVTSSTSSSATSLYVVVPFSSTFLQTFIEKWRKPLPLRSAFLRRRIKLCTDWLLIQWIWSHWLFGFRLIKFEQSNTYVSFLMPCELFNIFVFEWFVCDPESFPICTIRAFWPWLPNFSAVYDCFKSNRKWKWKTQLLKISISIDSIEWIQIDLSHHLLRCYFDTCSSWSWWHNSVCATWLWCWRHAQWPLLIDKCLCFNFKIHFSFNLRYLNSVAYKMNYDALDCIW